MSSEQLASRAPVNESRGDPRPMLGKALRVGPHVSTRDASCPGLEVGNGGFGCSMELSDTGCSFFNS